MNKDLSNKQFNDLLDYLNALNETGAIGYSVYSELFDKITNLYDSFEDAE